MGKLTSRPHKSQVAFLQLHSTHSSSYVFIWNELPISAVYACIHTCAMDTATSAREGDHFQISDNFSLIDKRHYSFCSRNLNSRVGMTFIANVCSK